MWRDSQGIVASVGARFAFVTIDDGGKDVYIEHGIMTATGLTVGLRVRVTWKERGNGKRVARHVERAR